MAPAAGFPESIFNFQLRNPRLSTGILPALRFRILRPAPQILPVHSIVNGTSHTGNVFEAYEGDLFEKWRMENGEWRRISKPANTGTFHFPFIQTNFRPGERWFAHSLSPQMLPKCHTIHTLCQLSSSFIFIIMNIWRYHSACTIDRDLSGGRTSPPLRGTFPGPAALKGEARGLPSFLAPLLRGAVSEAD